MKKYYLSLIAIILFAIAGCTKSSTSSSTMTYTVGSVPNCTFTQNVDTTIVVPVTVTLASGTQGTMTLTPTGMPAGITVLPTSFVGIPTFTTGFTFMGTPTTAGTYPITVTAASASGSKTSTFNLIVSPAGGGTGGTFTYSVTGVPSTITIAQYTDTTISLPLSVGLLSGTAGTVTLSGGTLPAGVSLFSATTVSGTPTFSSTVSMNLNMTTPGTYPVTINASSPGTTTQSYTFNVVVTASSNCVPEVTGTYTNAVTSCIPALTPYPTTCIVSATSTPYQIELQALGGDVTTYAIINCSTGTVSSMTGSNADFVLTGTSGTFSSTQVILNYTLAGGAGYSCTTTLTK